MREHPPFKPERFLVIWMEVNRPKVDPNADVFRLNRIHNGIAISCHSLGLELNHIEMKCGVHPGIYLDPFYLRDFLKSFIIHPYQKGSFFKESIDFIREYEFPFVDIYAYDDRPNTAASQMDGKIAPDVIDQRVAAVKKVQKQILTKLN